ncbi:T9SS type A sorting domain-containing protein [Gracilimonas mengyeensis]|uniref:Por secretion system C-terminal sorting domain-containing protein n=1 Tax=Gracilimonas mengyeensis TaxID=1302730 RepID=A0A521C637_9BACT|nr:T9SS type A sorting domain-containing protein [Gracilimonas mengyeensis]SMO54899.1 Por secretion system C-terminal sorting domain-containing protein [Gracilimonas mengyeensis]
MKRILFILFLISFGFTTQAQQRIHPNLPSDFIRDVHFINESEIIFINEGGTIYKTYDGGDTWKLKEDFLYPLDKMHFLNEEVGFVKPTRAAEILYTTDGGESWESHPLSIYFRNNLLPITKSKILKSDYNGLIELNNSFYNVWEVVYEPPFFIDSSFHLEPKQYYGNLQQFEKAGSNRILALYPLQNAFEYGILSPDSLNLIIETDHKGTTWDTLFIGFDEFLMGIQFQDSVSGWAYSNHSIYKTIDGGLSWSSRFNSPNAGILSLSVPDSNTVFGLFWDQQQYLQKTFDSGDNWETSPLPSNTYSNGNYAVNFFNDSTGILFGDHFYKTNNSGISWESMASERTENIYSLDFWSPLEGLAITGNGFFKTETGGKSWKFLFKPEELVSNRPGNAVMLNKDEGWIASRYQIFHTTTGVENFEVHDITSDDEIYSGIAFHNNIGLLHSVAERLKPDENTFDFHHHYLTTDGGTTWQEISIEDSTNSLVSFEEVKITGPNHFWGMNRDGLWLSTDSAKTWNIVFDENGFEYTQCFDFLNSEIGVAATNRAVFFTKDGGESWIEMPRSSRPVDCKLFDKNGFHRYRYFEVNEDSKYLRMTFYEDGYVDIMRFRSTGTNMPFRVMAKHQVGRQPYLWAAGDGFTIVYDTPVLTITSNEPELSNIPNQITLEQNYPNPFNPTTVISYQLTGNSLVHLEVFDVTGRKVATLVDGQRQTAGNQQVTFDASGLSSGMYFYRLETGGKTLTRKMLLVK